MEWGIVRENDPYLYGQKVKSYLINGAKQLPGETEWPNARVDGEPYVQHKVSLKYKNPDPPDQ
mgnify:CR=1 FL=1